MMYGMTIFMDGSMSLFTITDSMIDGIIEDINYYSGSDIVTKTDKKISILKENEYSIYFYNNEDRKEKVLQSLDHFNVH